MLGALALQNSVDVRKDRVEPLLTNDLDNRLADQIGRATTEHLRIGFADEAISQIASAPYEHERSSVDNSFQFCSAGAQHVLDTPAVGEHVGGPHRPQASNIGVGQGTTRTLVPSGRSAIASTPRIGRFSCNATAMGERSCGIDEP